MTYNTSIGLIGHQPIATTSTVANHPLGTVISAWDPSVGTAGAAGEFIYLRGIDSTVVGSLVTYNASSYVTTLSPTTAKHGAPVAVAMSANVASQYGWYQIGGLAVVKKTAVAIAPQVLLYVSGTSGRVYATASAGKQINGMKSANPATIASATSTVLVMLDRPALESKTSAI